ncbi:hypothetical protein P4V86_02030 [Brevibacillus laterosporus]|nr:hypothetical protein [Brevibacillus laterosporus]MED1665478.1 hypothetical protein [Brevibacillus laterosporus]MED1671281.1 hypothetical protein [Brevibacillus laterosporus]MED1721070.1 hypothetical protein [Brevibacillus laterosporus]MED2002132.1 hypothetical protein [Brevibacillus laterosporus]MED4765472.1 hypothetical protein [Brevibacillus laterosporus]
MKKWLVMGLTALMLLSLSTSVFATSSATQVGGIYECTDPLNPDNC